MSRDPVAVEGGLDIGKPQVQLGCPDSMQAEVGDDSCSGCGPVAVDGVGVVGHDECLKKTDSGWRRLYISTGQQTYRVIKVKLILLLTNDQKTKNALQFNQDFLFKHILVYIILY